MEFLKRKKRNFLKVGEKTADILLFFVVFSSNCSLMAERPDAPASVAGGFVPLILIFIIFYVLLIRPQQKQMKEHKKMLAALKNGDRVITSGGIIGTITSIRDKEITLKIADNCTAQFTRSSVSAVVGAPAK